MLVTVIESLYLLYMFFIFKTKHSYSSALFDEHMHGYSVLRHDTGVYENKVCVLGKILAVVAVVLFFLRLAKQVSPSFVIVFNIFCIFVALLLNLNAFIYICPLIFSEMWIFLQS